MESGTCHSEQENHFSGWVARGQSLCPLWLWVLLRELGLAEIVVPERGGAELIT